MREGETIALTLQKPAIPSCVNIIILSTLIPYIALYQSLVYSHTPYQGEETISFVLHAEFSRLRGPHQ